MILIYSILLALVVPIVRLCRAASRGDETYAPTPRQRRQWMRERYEVNPRLWRSR